MNAEQIANLSMEELRKRLAVRERQLKGVHDISAALISHDDLDTILRNALQALLDLVDADAGSILLYDSDKKRLTFRHVIGSAREALMGVEIDPEKSEGRAATAYRTGKSILTPSTSNDSFDLSIDSFIGFRTESILTVPLKNTNGRSIGALQALNKHEGSFDLEDQDLLEIVSSVASTVISNASLAEEAQLAAVARAVGDLGHDIKNALTPIETMVETTLQTFIEPMYEELALWECKWSHTHPEMAAELSSAITPLQDWYPEVRVAVKDGCSDIREMVSEIADYIKGTQSTHFEMNGLSEVVEDRLRRLRVIAKNRRVQLHIEAEPGLPDFRFDRRLVGRAVFNLVNNALLAVNDAVKKGRLELRKEGFNIWVRLSDEIEGDESSQFAQIEVRDDGPGIPDSVKATLFTPNTISTTPGGTGIGTRFVKSVADAHGGHVGVESVEGKGSRFWIRLPIA